MTSRNGRNAFSFFTQTVIFKGSSYSEECKVHIIEHNE